MKTVEGGIVHRRNQDAKLAVRVQKIEFPTLQPNQTVPSGAQGTMFLNVPPPQIGHYSKGDVLKYEDGNQHNIYTLNVVSNIGPTKYSIEAQ